MMESVNTQTKNYRQIYFSGFARKLLDQLRDKSGALMENEKKRNKRQNFDYYKRCTQNWLKQRR